MTTDITTHILSSDALREIDIWVAKFPANQKRSAVLQSLRIAQEHNNGHLTTELMAAVADYLEIPHIAAYEVASFYSMYNHEPVGKYQICICTSISCKLCDSDKMYQYLQEKLGISYGETTPDKKFTLKKVGCLGACIGAPMFQINKQYYEHLTPERIDEILDNLE